MRNSLIAFIILSSCTSGSVKVPENILKREKFVGVLLDIQIEEGVKTQNAAGNRFVQYQQSESFSRIFEKHEVTRGQFLTSYEWYRDRPELLESVFEEVLDSLSKLEAHLKQGFADEYKAQRDSVDQIRSKKLDSIRVKLGAQ